MFKLAQNNDLLNKKACFSKTAHTDGLNCRINGLYQPPLKGSFVGVSELWLGFFLSRSLSIDLSISNYLSICLSICLCFFLFRSFFFLSFLVFVSFSYSVYFYLSLSTYPSCSLSLHVRDAVFVVVIGDSSGGGVSFGTKFMYLF